MFSCFQSNAGCQLSPVPKLPPACSRLQGFFTPAGPGLAVAVVKWYLNL